MDFIKQFLKNTSEQMYVCSLSNVKGEGVGERHILSRDAKAIKAFVKKWDVKGRGVFYCVSTLPPRKARNKANVAETWFFHSDIDFKNIAIKPDEALKIVKNNCSRVHHTGNGLHGLWMLKAPTREHSRVETVLKLLCEKFGGDRLVTHCAALMRMPGTHNSKNDKWLDVTTVHESPKRYSLEQVEAWMLDREILIPRIGEDENPFARVGRELSFKAPIDVKQRLAAMVHSGAGDSAIHATQLAVSASMLNAGVDVEEVVETLMEATRKVGEDHWNWVEEERNIRRMCATWEQKHPIAVDNVVSLGAKRAERAGKKQEADLVKGGKAQAHIVLGRGIIESLDLADEHILFNKGQLWHCRDGVWTAYSAAEERSWFDRQVELGCRALKIISTTKLVSETRAWLQRNPELHHEEIEWDGHGKIPTKSGLVDPKTLKVTALTLTDYVTHVIDCEYQPKAKCPWWLTMLADTFADQATIDMLQEVLGAALLDRKPRTLMRALVLVGPSNSGKSNLLNVMAGLISDNPITAPFDTLENAHGMVPFLVNAPWLLHEAFDQSKWHFSSKTKALLSGDHVSVNIKNGPLITHCYTSPVFWGTNAPPQFKESSKAMEHRMIIVKCHAKFSSNKLTGVAAKAVAEGYASPSAFVLATEMPGILNWALAGMQRAVQRGQFLTTAEVREAMHEMQLYTNLIAGFMEECVIYDDNQMIATTDFYGAFYIWWQENNGDRFHAPSSDAVGRALVALADPRIAINRTELRHNSRRHYAGIVLNETGLDMWKGYSNSRFAADHAVRLSESAGTVNKTIPGEWLYKEIIRRLREATKIGVDHIST